MDYKTKMDKWLRTHNHLVHKQTFNHSLNMSQFG